MFINTKSMKDRETAATINEKADRMLDTYVPMADEIFRSVEAKLYSRRIG